MPDTLTGEQLRIVPANEASWADIQTIFGERGDAHGCQCQWFKLPAKEWRALPRPEREQRQRELTNCGDPEAGTTGLVAYVDEEPAGWVAVEPRVDYVRMRAQRIPWLGRNEDKTDAGVWSITCFVTRVGYRKRGLTHVLARAATEYAREHGATAVEGYPLITAPGETVIWGQLFVGPVSAFASAGFSEVSRPSARRAVMRLDF